MRVVAICLVGFALVVAPAGCRRQSVARTPDRDDAKRAAPVGAADHPAPVGAADAPRLSEDPVAGKRSEQQWREHMLHEEDERQLGFDRKRLKQHRAVVKLIVAARARYDRAHSGAAVTKVRADMPPQIAELRRRVTEIDRWGVNSRLLPDYEALAVSLTDAYADAKIAAIKGDATALKQARADFDQRMQKIADWLKEAAESKDE